MAGALQLIQQMRDRVAQMGQKLLECRQIADTLEDQPAMDPKLEAMLKELVEWWEARNQG